MRALILLAVPARVEAEDGELAAVAIADPLEDLDGRGLAGPVRAQEAEHLAGFDVEAHAGDGLDVAVPLAQVAAADDGAVGCRR